MIFVLSGLCCLVLTEGVMIPKIKPPDLEVISNVNYNGGNEKNESIGFRIRKSLLNVSDPLAQAAKTELENKKNNLSYVKADAFGPVRDAIYKNYLNAPLEPTTYRYPKAVWSSLSYEKLKNKHFESPSFKKFQQRISAYDHVRRRDNFTSEKKQRRNRGKIKWKNIQAPRRFENGNGNESDLSRNESNNFADKFLEQSLSNYLSSSKLKKKLGNVSVKTFSEVLKNVTDQKSKKPQSPYDENKELRMKFREEVILKKKNVVLAGNDTKSLGKFLEKQLQKRLEKVQDVFNEKDKEKILANMWKYATLNRTGAETSEELKKFKTDGDFVETDVTTMTTTATSTTPQSTETRKKHENDLVYATTPKKSKISSKPFRGNVRYTDKSRYTSTEKSGDYLENVEGNGRRNSITLTAEESSYYRQGRFPSLTFIGQPEKFEVIPGTPFVDYPVYSFPPPTKFKCPKFSDGKPKMMADKETRCQVFYVCTGAGPTTAMLCPNGTMFNENFLVCDWWYNVHC